MFVKLSNRQFTNLDHASSEPDWILCREYSPKLSKNDLDDTLSIFPFSDINGKIAFTIWTHVQCSNCINQFFKCSSHRFVPQKKSNAIFFRTLLHFRFSTFLQWILPTQPYSTSGQIKRLPYSQDHPPKVVLGTLFLSFPRKGWRESVSLITPRYFWTNFSHLSVSSSSQFPSTFPFFLAFAIVFAFPISSLGRQLWTIFNHVPCLIAAKMEISCVRFFFGLGFLFFNSYFTCSLVDIPGHEDWVVKGLEGPLMNIVEVC